MGEQQPVEIAATYRYSPTVESLMVRLRLDVLGILGGDRGVVETDKMDLDLRDKFGNSFMALCGVGTVEDLKSFLCEFEDVVSRMLLYNMTDVIRANGCFAMARACERGARPLVEFLSYMFCANDILPPLCASTSNPLLFTVKAGLLNFATWLVERFRLRDIPDVVKRATAISYGASDLEGIKWVYETFGRGAIETRPGVCCALRGTVYHAKYNVAEWLIATYGVEELKDCVWESYVGACSEGGNCEYAEWLAAKFSLPAETMFRMRLTALIEVVNYGRTVDDVEYLAGILNLRNFSRARAAILWKRYQIFNCEGCAKTKRMLHILGPVSADEIAKRQVVVNEQVEDLVEKICSVP